MYRHLKEGCEEDGARFFPYFAQQWDQRQWTQTKTEEVPSDKQETPFYWESDWHKAPIEVVEFPYFEIYKSYHGYSPGHLV